MATGLPPRGAGETRQPRQSVSYSQPESWLQPGHFDDADEAQPLSSSQPDLQQHQPRPRLFASPPSSQDRGQGRPSETPWRGPAQGALAAGPWVPSPGARDGACRGSPAGPTGGGEEQRASQGEPGPATPAGRRGGEDPEGLRALSQGSASGRRAPSQQMSHTQSFDECWAAAGGGGGRPPDLLARSIAAAGLAARQAAPSRFLARPDTLAPASASTAPSTAAAGAPGYGELWRRLMAKGPGVDKFAVHTAFNKAELLTLLRTNGAHVPLKVQKKELMIEMLLDLLASNRLAPARAPAAPPPAPAPLHPRLPPPPPRLPPPRPARRRPRREEEGTTDGEGGEGCGGEELFSSGSELPDVDESFAACSILDPAPPRPAPRPSRRKSGRKSARKLAFAAGAPPAELSAGDGTSSTLQPPASPPAPPPATQHPSPTLVSPSEPAPAAGSAARAAAGGPPRSADVAVQTSQDLLGAAAPAAAGATERASGPPPPPPEGPVRSPPLPKKKRRKVAAAPPEPPPQPPAPATPVAGPEKPAAAGGAGRAHGSPPSGARRRRAPSRGTGAAPSPAHAPRPVAHVAGTGPRSRRKPPDAAAAAPPQRGARGKGAGASGRGDPGGVAAAGWGPTRSSLEALEASRAPAPPSQGLCPLVSARRPLPRQYCPPPHSPAQPPASQPPPPPPEPAALPPERQPQGGRRAGRSARRSSRPMDASQEPGPSRAAPAEAEAGGGPGGRVPDVGPLEWRRAKLAPPMEVVLLVQPYGAFLAARGALVAAAQLSLPAPYWRPLRASTAQAFAHRAQVRRVVPRPEVEAGWQVPAPRPAPAPRRAGAEQDVVGRSGSWRRASTTSRSPGPLPGRRPRRPLPAPARPASAPAEARWRWGLLLAVGPLEEELPASPLGSLTVAWGSPPGGPFVADPASEQTDNLVSPWEVGAVVLAFARGHPAMALLEAALHAEEAPRPPARPRPALTAPAGPRRRRHPLPAPGGAVRARARGASAPAAEVVAEVVTLAGALEAALPARSLGWAMARALARATAAFAAPP
eukprot:tig00021123_g18486.t1